MHRQYHRTVLSNKVLIHNYILNVIFKDLELVEKYQKLDAEEQEINWLENVGEDNDSND